MRAVIATMLAAMVMVGGCVPCRLSMRDDGVIAFPGDREVFLYDPRTEKVDRIALPIDFGTTVLSVEWSPDGKQLLAVSMCNKGGEETWWIISADGKEIRKMAARSLIAHWTPDGKGITFLGGADRDQMSLKLMEMETGKTVTLLHQALPFYCWEPKGEYLAAFQMLVGSVETSETGIAELVLAAEGEKHATGSIVPFVDYPWLTFSRDGQKVLFAAPSTTMPLSLRGTNDEMKKLQEKVGLYAVDVETGEMVRLTKRKIGYAEYSPDGKHILFVELTGKGKTRVGVMRADGTRARTLDSGRTLNKDDARYGVAKFQPVWLSNTRVQYYRDKAEDAKAFPDPAWWAIDIDRKNREELGAKVWKLVEELLKEERKTEGEAVAE